MATIKKNFFKDGVDNQKYSNISFSAKIDDLKKVSEWSKEQKQEAKKFIDDCIVYLQRYAEYVR